MQTNEFHMTPTRSQATYAAGSDITVSFTITANHGGRIGVRVCPLPAAQADQECFDRPEHQLTRADGPPSVIGKRYMYIVGSATSVSSRWRLPPGVSCPGGCVLQWVSCNKQLLAGAGAGSGSVPGQPRLCRLPGGARILLVLL